MPLSQIYVTYVPLNLNPDVKSAVKQTRPMGEGQEKLMISMALEIILGRASTNPSFIHKHFEVLSPLSPPSPLGDLTCVDLPLTPLSKLALGINIPPPCYVS